MECGPAHTLLTSGAFFLPVPSILCNCICMLSTEQEVVVSLKWQSRAAQVAPFSWKSQGDLTRVLSGGLCLLKRKQGVSPDTLPFLIYMLGEDEVASCWQPSH